MKSRREFRLAVKEANKEALNQRASFSAFQADVDAAAKASAPSKTEGGKHNDSK